MHWPLPAKHLHDARPRRRRARRLLIRVAEEQARALVALDDRCFGGLERHAFDRGPGKAQSTGRRAPPDPVDVREQAPAPRDGRLPHAHDAGRQVRRQVRRVGAGPQAPARGRLVAAPVARERAAPRDARAATRGALWSDAA